MIMQSDALHFNVSKCLSSHRYNEEQELAEIPSTLLYACLHWPHHIAQAAAYDLSILLDSLEALLFSKFLFWIEVLSVTENSHLSSSLIMKLLTTQRVVCHSFLAILS